MSSKLFLACVGAAVLASVGCSGVFVPKQQYDRDTAQQKEYIEALEREVASLRPKADAYDKLKGEMDLTAEANRINAELAESLKRALAGLGVDERDVYVDPRTGAVVMATDLLFDSGSYEISAKGREVLRKFAESHRGSQLKIVGHTDRRRVALASTKQKLDTDTNLELSAKRAVAVMGELLKGGVPERQMWIEAKGSTEPRSGGDKACRRVEIFVAGGAAPAAGARTSLK